MRYISLMLLFCLVGCIVPREETITNDVSVAYLWSLAQNRSTPIKEDIVLHGYISANDILGEYTKSFILSDSSGGIEVKVDATNIERILPWGCAISLHCSGLYIGREGGRLVLGAKPTDVYSVDRIPEDEIFNYVTIIDGEIEPLRADLMDITDIGYDDMFRYVMLQNIAIIEEERGLCWCDIDEVSGERITTIRHLTDGSDTIALITSPSALYSSERVAGYRARCIGVVDIYKEMVALRLSNYQITPME